MINEDLNIMEVHLSAIKIRPEWNIRSGVDDLGEVTTLMTSIQEIGLQHPITINTENEIISGHRRFRACKNLKMPTIMAKVVKFDNPDLERLAHLDENIESKTLPQKELDRAIAEKKKIYYTIYKDKIQQSNENKSFTAEIAEKLQTSESNVKRKIARVENTSEAVRNAYEEDKINATQVDELVKISKDIQDKILPRIIGLSVEETKLIVDDVKSTISKEKKQPKGIKKRDKPIPIAAKDPNEAQAILDTEKTIKAIRQADILLNNLFVKSQVKILEDDYKKRLYDNVQLILHTIDSRIGISNFYPDSEEVDEIQMPDSF